MEKDSLFATMRPGKALAIMALPTVASQLIIVIYNIVDTWFIGRTNNPYMIAASSLALTLFLLSASFANIFGVGGGSLMVRLLGEKKVDEARKVASYSVAFSFIVAAILSIVVLIFMDPILKFLGASDNTLDYSKQYIIFTTVLGAIPTVLSMSMPQLLRNAGYSKEAGIGIALGSLLNIALDPLFMFVILPKGYEVMGAALATLIANVVSFIYFIVVFRKVRDKTVLVIPKKVERIGKNNLKSLYSVGIPVAISIFLFDLVTIVLNKITALFYGDIALAAMGIVLKMERLPINIGIGVCLAMVPLVAYNYGSKDYVRMSKFLSLSRMVIIIFSVACVAGFWIFAEPICAAFIDDAETVTIAAFFLRGRSFALPFMMIGYHLINFANATNRGKVSLFMAVFRHLILIVPIVLLMNHLFGIIGLTYAQFVADFIGAMVSIIVFVWLKKSIMRES